ncbi:MAG TPA: TIGR00296 family protein [Thermoplasmata archaeon]|nr:TIGR00296 family protein [Thermoplasmata archaeon]
MFTDEEGKIAVKLARDSVEAAVKGVNLQPRALPDTFKKKYGAFTTLKTFPNLLLRGCIGIPEPIMPLAKAVVESAVSACLNDPRFPPVQEYELDEIVVEVSLMTKPELIQVSSPDEYLNKIKIGKDGLVLKGELNSGLLLPQVPVEWGWDVKRFLEAICEKSGLRKDCWKEKDIKLYRFQAEIFHELSPYGEIKRMNMNE